MNSTYCDEELMELSEVWVSLEYIEQVECKL